MFLEVITWIIIVIIFWALPLYFLVKNLKIAGMSKGWYVFVILPVYIWIPSIISLVKASKMKKSSVLFDDSGDLSKLNRLLGNKEYMIVSCPNCKTMVSLKKHKSCPECKSELPSFACNKCESKNLRPYNEKTKLVGQIWSIFLGIGIIGSVFMEKLIYSTFLIPFMVIWIVSLVVAIGFSIYFFSSSKKKRVKCLDCKNDMHFSEIEFINVP